MTLVEMRQQRGALVEQMRKLQERATLENRDLTAEEGQEFDRIDAEQDALGKRIIRDERMEAIRLDLNRPTSEPLRPMPGDEHRGGAPIANPRATPAYQAAFRNYLLDGPAAILTMPIAEQRNLQMDILAKGGALVAPEEFNATLIKAVDDLVFIRQFATKYTVTSAEAMGVPTLDADPADADWTSELATGSLDTTMAFGKRELKPHPLAKQVKASNKLLRASAIGPEALVRDRLAYKFAVTEEKTFLTGSGNQQPLGLFTASADGVPTSRDVSTGNTATAITADGLIEAKYTLKAAYWPRARWIFSTTAVKNVRKLKDGNGQYLWAPGLAGGTPDTILDVPYSVSEYAPATFTTGLYVGLIGDLSKYWIVDALTLTVQRLVELYAATNQTGFIGRAEVDGAPVLAEAFVRVKLA